MALPDDLLPLVESLRGLPGQLGFRPYTSVAIRTRTWTGAEPGDGTSSDVTLSLAAGGQPARVREITSREVQASAGRYTAADMRVGPLTPQHPVTGGGTAGYTPAELDPSSSARNVERHVVLTGPGEDGSVWTILEAKLDRALGDSLVIRRTERTT